MIKLRKVVIGLAAASMVAAPVVASAAPVGAVSSVDGQSDLEGNSSWIIGLIGLLAGVTAAILLTDDDDKDSPVSP